MTEAKQVKGRTLAKVPERRSQMQRREEMRQLVAKAAFDEIAEFGHSAFRTAAVFRRAGVSKGGMQHHFPTKDALTLAAVRYGLEQSATVTAKIIDQDARDGKELVGLLFKDLLIYFGDERFWVILDITIHASKMGDLAGAIHHMVNEYRSPVYERWKQRLIDFGWSAERADAAVKMATALVSGSAVRFLWTREPPSVELQDIWQQAILKVADAPDHGS
jgi:AcrR family transcriptional regulator